VSFTVATLTPPSGQTCSTLSEQGAVATDQMAEAGFTSLVNLQGGVADLQGAGAPIVALSSPKELVITQPLDHELEIDKIAATLTTMQNQVDLILTEGYKRAHKPKIEVSRRERGTEPVSRREDIIAIVSDHPITLDVPRFDLDDAVGVADLIQTRYL